MEKPKEKVQSKFILLTSLSHEDYRTADVLFENNETKNCPINDNEMMNIKEISQQQSKCEMKIGLFQNEFEEKTKKRSIRNNITFFIGAIIICIIFILKSEGEQNVVLGLKKFYEKKSLLHKNENENNLELEPIQKQLQFLQNIIEKEQKEYEQKLLTLQKEHENELEIFKKKLDLLSNMTKGENWKKEHEKELERARKTLQDLLKIIGKEPNWKKQALLCLKEEQNEMEQKEKEEKEKEKEEKLKEKNWKKNADLILNQNDIVLLCLQQKEKEEAASIQLKLSIKTIHEEHEKHFRYLAELLGFKTLNELNTSLRLLFRASEHRRPLADKFHELCDGKGPTITIIRSEHKKLFGGYSSVSWHSNGWSSAPGSFIFSLDNQTKHNIDKNEKFAIRGNAEYGPSFGGSDIVLSYKEEINDPARPNWSNMGYTYSLPAGVSFESDAAQSYLAGSYRFKVDEYEVYEVLNPSLIQLKSNIKTIHEDHEKHFKYLAKLLNFKTLNQLATKLHLLFRASEHNFSKNKFHELCDGKGPTITIVRSNHKKLFGGYSSISWFSSRGYSSSPGSYLFSLDKHTKHNLYKNQDEAIYGYKDRGPSFGYGWDLIICHSDNCINSSKLGWTYSLPESVVYGSNEADSYLAGSLTFETEEYEGYASIPWHSNAYSPAPESFIFSLDKQTKHVIYRNTDNALFGNSSHGPSFGIGNDLLLDHRATGSEPHSSNLGGTYSLPEGMTFQSDEAQSYLAGSLFFGLEEYEVFGLDTDCWQDEVDEELN